MGRENKTKCKKALQKGNKEGAQIYAQNAIRAKNQSLNYLKLSARMDAIAARIKTAIDMKQMTGTMKAVTVSMTAVMKSTNIEQLSKTMDKFEEQFEQMDLNSQYMEQAIDSSTAQTMPESQVNELMQEVADENGLEFESQLADSDLSLVKSKQKQKESADENKDDQNSLEARLAKLGD